MTAFLLAAPLLMASLAAGQGVPTYTVIAPDVVRPNTDFLVAVTAHEVPRDQDVELRIRGVSDAGQTIEIRQATTVQSDQTQIVRLRIGDLGSGAYTLSARGADPISFDQTSPLTYVHKGYSVFVQTDKAIYRPGNTVKFRVIVVTPALKPSVVGSIDVAMTDGGGNKIRDWKRVFTTKGVFAGELEIADAPVLGDWNVTVDVSGQLFTKSFLVAEYVLPKFEVSIELPDYWTLADGDLTATVKAHYKHGGPVKGEATVAVFPKYKSSYIQPIFAEPVRRVTDIDGAVDVTFNLPAELNLSPDYVREIVFDVKVKEDKTERIQNNTASLFLYKERYKLELVKTAEAFKPGMRYRAYLKVSNQDDSPVRDDLHPVSVRWGYSYFVDTYNTTEFAVPESGIIELTFDVPEAGEVDVLGIEATYKNLTQWFSTIPRARSTSNHYLQARLNTAAPEVGQNVRIGITSTEPLKSFTYQIYGRGKLVFAETLRGVAVADAADNEINFRATSDMSPRCRVIVYYVRESSDAEIVADSLEFEVKGALTNFVDIWASRKNAIPGSDVTINVKTKPNSFVGIMAVDRSVRSLKAGHDIIRDDVIRELRSYDSGRDPSFFPWFRVIAPAEGGSLYWYTGAEASAAVFASSGAVILTNARLQAGRRTDENAPRVVHNGENRPIGRPLPSPDAETLNADKGPAVEYETITRPPLAGPYAFSRLPQPVDNHAKVYLKADLPDTWLFVNTTTDLEGTASVPVKVPALANTSWIITGFAIDSLHGMGIAEELRTLDVFQPFFVKVDLPYAVKRGETVAVEMVVYNYLEREISAEVTLENPEGKSFAFGSANPNEVDDGGDAKDFELFRTKRIAVKPGRGTLLSFIITPLRIGLTEMKITAKSGGVGQDVQVKKLRVEADGETLHNNTGYLLDLRSTGIREFNLTLALPRTAIKGSERVVISAAADPLGPAMNNLGADLIYYPLGCGEQNMIRIVPPVIVAEYLRGEGVLYLRARALMEDGYQRQLAYKLRDGSFSAFGEVDKRGSVWVTSLTARYLRLAGAFIDIDEAVVGGALAWLADAQGRDGSWKELGKITHSRLQEDSMALTAYVSACFLDNQFNLDATLRNSMNRAVSYLAEGWADVEDPFVLAIVNYVLHRADHPQKDALFAKVLELAKKEEGGAVGTMMWWETPLEGFEEANPWTQRPNSANIEMTAYNLLALLLRADEFERSVSVVNWLLTQQNENGGFASTSDTFVGVQAIKEFSEKLNLPVRGSEINVQYSYLDTVRQLGISAQALTIHQRRILDPATRRIAVRATGSGLGLLQVGYQYNLNVTAAWPSFVVNPQVFRPSTSSHMQITICVNYIEGGASRTSNMAVMEVNLPSGFTANMDALHALRRFPAVKRVDTERGDTKVVLYFEQLTRSEICPTVSAYRTHRVANQKPASVLVYDYYDQSRVARSFYDIVPATLCDICLGDDCPDDGCPARPTFPTFGSYAYGENIDSYLADGGARGDAAPAGLLLLLAVSAILFSSKSLAA